MIFNVRIKNHQEKVFMRNILEIPNIKRQNYKKLIFIATLFFILSIILFPIILISFLSLNIEDVVEINGKIKDIEYKNEEYVFYLDDDSEYHLVSVVSGHLDKEELEKLNGQNVILYNLEIGRENDIIGFTTDVYSLDKETGFNYVKDNSLTGTMVLSIMLSLSVIMLIFSIYKLCTTKKTARGDVFKLINEQTIPPISPARKNILKFLLIPIILALIFLIPMCVYSEINTTLFYIFLALFLVSISASFILTLILLPYIQKREIKEFDLLYQSLFELKGDNFSPLVMDQGNFLVFKLTEKGLEYREEYEADLIMNSFVTGQESEEELQEIKNSIMLDIRQSKNNPPPKRKKNKNFINYFENSELIDNTLIQYDELNLTTKVCFKVANQPFALFISSNLQEMQYPTLRNDIFIELTEDIYYYIKKYNIKVNGLDRFLQNRKDFMTKYCQGVYKGKFSYIEFTDDDEKILFNSFKQKTVD